MRAGQSWVSHCRTGRVTWEILTGHAGRPRSGWWGTWDSRPSAVPGGPGELSWVGHSQTLFQTEAIRPSPLTSTHPLALWMVNKTESMLMKANSVIGTKIYKSLCCHLHMSSWWWTPGSWWVLINRDFYLVFFKSMFTNWDAEKSVLPYHIFVNLSFL